MNKHVSKNKTKTLQKVKAHTQCKNFDNLLFKRSVRGFIISCLTPNNQNRVIHTCKMALFIEHSILKLVLQNKIGTTVIYITNLITGITPR